MNLHLVKFRGLLHHDVNLSLEGRVGAAGIASGAAVTTACLVRAHNLKKRSQFSVYNAPLYQHEFTFNNGTTLATGIDILKDSRINNQTLGIGLRYNF